MDKPGKRSNYTMLSQNDDDHRQPPAAAQPQPKFSALAGEAGPYYDSFSRDSKNKGKSDRGVDWDLFDHWMAPQTSRTGVGFPGSIGLQRQSSGSSFGDSSVSGEYYMPSAAAGDPEAFGHFHDDAFKVGGGGESRFKAEETSGGGVGSSSSSKSWAQQTQESYQLQLALALRLSSEATSADDPNLLDDPTADESAFRSLSSSDSAESLSYRFWVNGCLSYFDRIPDGFYLIHGINPYVWTICTDTQESGRIPPIESLRAVDPRIYSSIEVILVDQRSDPSLKELEKRIHTVSCNCITPKDVVDQLSKIVCNHMGGSASTGECDFVPIWKEWSDDLKGCLGSVVLPIGRLSVGLCRHRALLFKVLADTIDLPCRIAKGCKYCMRDAAASCLVRFGLDREYLVDLVLKPGCLSEPDSLLNGPSSISISSPLRFPHFGQVDPSIDFKSLAKQFFSDFQSLNIEFDDFSSGVGVDGDAGHLTQLKQSDSCVSSSSESSKKPDGDVQPFKQSTNPDKDQVLPKNFPPIDFDVEDLDIPWSELDLKERIGAGSFGIVHRADWRGSDVAVKILMDQDLHSDRLKEFLREVRIMKRLRHPNIVLFMGAVTHPPHLSIVTEYLSRGSLYRLLHKPGAKEMLDEKRRLSMAFDVAKGMNYLHKCNPPIVHRDLKSPNLLVDKKYTVKDRSIITVMSSFWHSPFILHLTRYLRALFMVCDFGLSRLKASTFLSSKSAAGTPEWMAPEVLRDEPSNEKSDVYSFGVILWELVTLQQPWSHLNPAQVVAAVGFYGKRLEIPHGLNPQVAAMIEACWASEPLKRPSFSSIMESLKALIKTSTPQLFRADMHPLT